MCGCLCDLLRPERADGRARLARLENHEDQSVIGQRRARWPCCHRHGALPYQERLGRCHPCEVQTQHVCYQGQEALLRRCCNRFRERLLPMLFYFWATEAME